jgi:hypothetical protein
LPLDVYVRHATHNLITKRSVSRAHYVRDGVGPRWFGDRSRVRLGAIELVERKS